MAAQDAELKLKVSLDLAFFRQQLAGLGQVAAGYNMPINIKLDRSAVTKELRNLERAIGKKKINVELNLLGGLTKDQLEKIQGRLEALSKTKKVEIPVSVKNGATGKDIQDAITGIRQRIAANQQIRQGDGKLRIATSIKPSITNADVSEFKKTVQQKLSGISVKVKAEVERGFAAGPTGAAGLFEYMRSQGLSGGNVPQATEVGRSERLKKALNDLTVKQLQALAKEQGIGGVSKMRKDPLIEKLVAELNQDIAENILGNIKNQLRDVGKGPLKSVLDTFARGLFNMLGMDAAAMRQQMAERRALPAVSFPATVPPRLLSIGPSSTGRALPPGATPGALPGTAFAGQKYLPTDLGAELKQILRGAAYAFVDAMRREVRTVKIGIGASMQAALPSARIAGFLPAGVGREPSRYATGAIGGESREQMMARRTAEAYARSALRGLGVMAERQPALPGTTFMGDAFVSGGGRDRVRGSGQPPQRGGAIVPYSNLQGQSSQMPPGYYMLGKLPEQLRRADEFLSKRKVPLTGAIQELGSEFGEATKQVLLYGTAYKALAFFTSLPGQALEAAKGLETFRNQLSAVTDSTGQFGPSLKFIENSIKELNVPINSAREGFTRLFASLQPAGFNPGTIQDLFSGITKAAATFGLSADEVDRVFYAFGQMASKGQVMSEELKGQLGDVLPGSVALFAEAAKMSMTEFSQALEDGMFKGDAMKVLLENVATLMSTKFSDAASKASQTLQGQMNAMQNSLQLMYESLQPMVNAFAAAVGPAIQSMISDATDVIKAFNSNVALGGEAFDLMTPRAQDFYATLKNLVPSITAAAKNVGEFASSLSIAASPLAAAIKLALDFISMPFVARVGFYAVTVGVLTTAFQLLVRSGIVQATAAIIRFIATLSISQIQTWITAIRSAIAALVTMTTTANATRIALTALKVTLVSFGVGAVLIGLDFVIQRLIGIGDAANKARQRAAELTDELNRAVEAGNTAVASERYVQAETRVQSIDKAMAILERLKTGPQKITKAEYETLQRTGLASGINYFGGTASGGRMQVQANLDAAQRGRVQALNEAGQAQEAMRDAAQVAQNRQRQLDAARTELKDIPPGEGDDADKKGRKLGVYIQDATKLLQAQKEERLLLIENSMLRDEISETEAKRRALLVEKIYEEKAVLAGLAAAEKKVAGENLSAADKQLKIDDLRAEKAQRLANIQKRYGVDVLKTELELQKPFKDALAEVNAQLDEQAMLKANLSGGLIKLTNDQKAYLDVQRLSKDIAVMDAVAMQEFILALRRKREEYYKNEEALKRQISLQEKINEVEGIGTGLIAGYFGSAASVFEKAMADSDGDLGYAKRMADLETAAMQLRSVFEGIQEAIGGIGEAFGSVLTEGIASMVAGTATAKEVFASFLQSVAQALAQAASRMIATYIAIGIAKMFAGFGDSLNMAKSGITETTLAPMRQYPMAKGGTFGPVAQFANGGTFTDSIVSSPTFFQFADGGSFKLGLMGEAGPEAVMPLKRGPDGRLGVSMYDASRKAVANAGGNASMDTVDDEDSLFSIGSPSAARRTVAAAAEAVAATRMQVMEQRTLSERRSEMRHIEELVAKPAKINVEYQSQVINNVEYVTRDQAERMAAQSALRGRELALSSLQNSVKARKRVGMG